jgi:hypothetical protein
MDAQVSNSHTHARARTHTHTHTHRFKVFTAVKFEVEVLWVVTPCSVAVGYQRLRGPCCLHHFTLKMTAPHHRRLTRKRFSYLSSLCLERFWNPTTFPFHEIPLCGLVMCIYGTNKNRNRSKCLSLLCKPRFHYQQGALSTALGPTKPSLQ